MIILYHSLSDAFPLFLWAYSLKAAEPDIHFSESDVWVFAAACSNGVRQKGHFIKIDGGLGGVTQLSVAQDSLDTFLQIISRI